MGRAFIGDHDGAARDRPAARTPIVISDPQDPRIDAYRQVRERDLVGRQHGFIVEGEVVLTTAIRRGRHPLVSVLVDEKRFESLGPMLADLDPGIPVYAARQAVMDAVVGFHIHRGILALGRRAEPVTPRALLAGVQGPGVVLALFGIGNHDNMGGLFRNAAAFGAAAVLLGSDCCDPLYRKAIRVSVGAALTTPFARLEPGDDPLAVLAEAGFEALALSPAGRERLSQAPRPERAALLLGAEGPGLPPELLAGARTLSIPMAAGWDSLNVAVAGALALNHLTLAHR